MEKNLMKPRNPKPTQRYLTVHINPIVSKVKSDYQNMPLSATWPRRPKPNLSEGSVLMLQTQTIAQCTMVKQNQDIMTPQLKKKSLWVARAVLRSHVAALTQHPMVKSPASSVIFVKLVSTPSPK